MDKVLEKTAVVLKKRDNPHLFGRFVNSVYTFAIHAVFIQYSHLILMKITKVNIPKSLYDNGIDDINMDRLGKFVLLAGKNDGENTVVKKNQAMS